MTADQAAVPLHVDERRFVRGRGSYVADRCGPDTLHVAFARSRVPHGTLEGFDVSAATAKPGVVGVWTASDLAGLLHPLDMLGTGLQQNSWQAMPADRVRFLGQPVAAVVAGSRHEAEDAADAVAPTVLKLDVVSSVDAALAPDAVRLYDGLPDNVLFSMSRTAGDPDAIFADSDVVIERTFHHGRQTPFPLENRGVLAEMDGAVLTVTSSTQIPYIVQAAVAKSLGRSEDSVRVITPDVGGGFGLKLQVFGEEVVVALLATLLSRPVAWIEDRSENLRASAHAHDQRVTVRLAADRDGRLRAAAADVDVDAGAYSVYPLSASLDVSTALSRMFAVYELEHLTLRGRAVATNKAPVGAYRGVGFPAGVFATERMMDLLAAEIGRDAVAVRERNLVRREAMPYRHPTGSHLDTGDYPRALREVVAALDVEQWRQRQDAAPATAPIGIGVIVFNEHSGPGSRAYRLRGVETVPGFEAATVRLLGDGQLAVAVSSADAGQRHGEAYRMLAAEHFGLDPNTVGVVEGDTAGTPAGSGTFASRAGTAQMTCVHLAADELTTLVRDAAGTLLGCPPEDVELSGGAAHDRRSGATVPLADVALSAGDTIVSAGGEETKGIESTVVWDSEPTFPYGAHACVTRVDLDTLEVEILGYAAVEDCGRVVSERGVEDQLRGGIAMGVGDALLEEHVYAPDGELLTSTLFGYLVPFAHDVPIEIVTRHFSTPTDRTPLGAKGVGEAGTIGAIAAVGCAVADALQRVGGELRRLPASPQAIFGALGEGEHVRRV